MSINDRISNLSEEQRELLDIYLQKTSKDSLILETDILPPESLLEEDVLAIWQDVLNIENLSVEQDFFEVGGDSILIIRLVSCCLKKDLKVEIKDVYENSTVRDLCNYLESLYSDTDIDNKVNIQYHKFAYSGLTKKEQNTILSDTTIGSEIIDIITLSPVQTGILYHHLRDNNNSYVTQWTCSVTGEFKPDYFERAIDQVSQQYSALRSIIKWKKLSQPVQVVFAKAELDIKFIHNQDADSVKNIIKDDFDRGIDLENSFSYRVIIIETGHQEYTFIWTHHHIIMDGWSQEIILREVFKRYSDIVLGQQVEITVDNTSEVLRAFHLEYVKSIDDSFWKHYLSGINHNIRYHSERKRKLTQLIELIDSDLYKKTKVLAADNRTTFNVVLQACWSIARCMAFSEEIFSYGLPFSGRNCPNGEVENAVGMFNNTLPVVIQIDSTQTVSKFIETIHKTLSELQAHQNDSMIEIRRSLSISGELYSELFVMENQPNALNIVDHALGFTLNNIETFIDESYPLVFVVIPNSDLTVLIKYDSNTYDKYFIKKLYAMFVTVLHEMILNDRAKIGSLLTVVADKISSIEKEIVDNRVKQHSLGIKSAKRKYITLTKQNDGECE